MAKLEAQNSDYSMKFMTNRKIFRDYPRLVSIETTGFCNATCLFCPHGDLPRRTKTMPEDLFEKILNDLSKIPDTVPVMISPNLINEPSALIQP
jgi:MoaA/NifB/PqqE/SkfB family radical SAM enzyme